MPPVPPCFYFRAMAQRVLITGGAGFIGSAVGRHMISLGHEVSVLDNLSFGVRELAPVDDDHFFRIDIRDRDEVFGVMESFRPDQVLHLAAIHFIPYCNAHPVEAADINISGTINVLDACAEVAVRKVFVASTAAVYPLHDGALTESHPTGPLDIYGITKLAVERLASEYCLRTGTPTVVGRFFNAFGPNETNPHLIPEIQRQLRGGQRMLRLGNLEPKRDFIHTSDMADAIGALLAADITGCEVFNIGRGIEYSVREIVDAFERQLGEPIGIEVDPERMRKTDRLHLLADVSKLKEKVGWEPIRGLDEGVRSLLEEPLMDWSAEGRHRR